MTTLSTLIPHFQDSFPRLATGNYVHFIFLRHSQSFPVFQTDGILNTIRTQAGLTHTESFSRLIMFKRKQTTPERLAGRELLRSLNITSAETNAENKAPNCEYNSQEFCKQCPDCILYGFAIGNEGSERSKVYSDSAFSLTPYEKSHQSLTFNALSENGTMSEGKEMRHSINELDHVIPEITFPSVETLRNSTYQGFIYVLGNLLRTRRYGAQESRTGTMKNYPIGIVFADGEIFSNLYFTQALYDQLEGQVDRPIHTLLENAEIVMNQLLAKEPVRKTKVIFGQELTTLIDEITALYQNETELGEILKTLYQQTQNYSQTYGAKSSGKAKGSKKSNK